MQLCSVSRKCNWDTGCFYRILHTTGVPKLFCACLIERKHYLPATPSHKEWIKGRFSLRTQFNFSVVSRNLFFLIHSQRNPSDSSCDLCGSPDPRFGITGMQYSVHHGLLVTWKINFVHCILTLNLRLGSSLRFTLVTTCPVCSSTSNILAEYGYASWSTL